jgi:hypothetical protein
MQILNQLETEPLPLEEEERRHTRRLLVGVLCALILTGSVFGGYMYLRKRHERQVAASEAAAADANRKAPAKVEVLVDDAVTNGGKSVLAGTVHNISNEPLHNIAVELQLRKRTGSTVETRVITPDSTELPPDGRARYQVEVPVQEYVSATFLRVVGGNDRAAVPSRAMPGAPRPAMEAPAPKTIVVGRPAAPKDGEFLNSEKNPQKVP